MGIGIEKACIRQPEQFLPSIRRQILSLGNAE
jgi:hypothetical protein